MAEQPDPTAANIDSSVPHSARIWNYWLGGKDNYEADRMAGDEYVKVYPGIVDIARAGRSFLARAVKYLVAEEGVRQFLDVGTGLPTAENTHQIAQRVAPECHIVYVDNDPMVLVHARALLTSSPEGATSYLDADMHDPETVLRLAAERLDFNRPIALLLMGVLGHIDTYEDVLSLIRRLMGGLPSGSFIALYDDTDVDEAHNEAQQGYDDTGAVPYRLRPPELIRGYFEDFTLVEPGVVACEEWRPEPSPFGGVPKTSTLCAVARKG